MKLSEPEIEELVQRKLEGESYSNIRSELGDLGLNESEIHETIRKIDGKVLDAEMNQKKWGRPNQWYRVGLFIAAFGLILTLGANRGIILQDVSRWIVYAPFFAGIGMMIYGRYARQGPPHTRNQGPDRIRRKRPFK
jgi:hypothetical protein